MEATLLFAIQKFNIQLAPNQQVVPEPSITLRPRYGTRAIIDLFTP